MKYRWYVVDTTGFGNPLGTNNEESADAFAASDEYVVIDTEDGTVYTIDDHGAKWTPVD